MSLLRSSPEGYGDHHRNALVPAAHHSNSAPCPVGSQVGEVIEQESEKSPTKECRIGD